MERLVQAEQRLSLLPARSTDLKTSALFSENVSAFFRSGSGLIPEKGRKNTGNRPEKKRKHFPEKERNLLSFKVWPMSVLAINLISGPGGPLTSLGLLCTHV